MGAARFGWTLPGLIPFHLLMETELSLISAAKPRRRVETLRYPRKIIRSMTCLIRREADWNELMDLLLVTDQRTLLKAIQELTSNGMSIGGFVERQRTETRSSPEFGGPFPQLGLFSLGIPEYAGGAGWTAVEESPVHRPISVGSSNNRAWRRDCVVPSPRCRPPRS